MAVDVVESIHAMARDAGKAAARLATCDTRDKDAALVAMADALVVSERRILEQNAVDLKAGRAAGLSDALIDRLTLTGKRIADMAEGLNQLAALPDPVGRVNRGWRLPNGLDIKKVSVPLGVIGVILVALLMRRHAETQRQHLKDEK